MMNIQPLQRRSDLDWLRVLAVLTIFIFHTTRFFSLEDWHVKNLNTYLSVEIWTFFITRWMMPLFFLLSGASLFYVLEKREGAFRFIKDKTLRLFVPVVVAVFSHSILQVYLERLSHHQFSGSLIEFVPHYFHGLYLGVGSSGNFAFHGMHLWYLLILFIYGLMFYPFFYWLMNRGENILGISGRLMAKPGLMYILLPLPLLLMKITINEAVLSVGNGGWGFLYYIWFLMAGFMIISSKPLQETIQRQRRSSLILGIIFSGIFLILKFGSVNESGLPAQKLVFFVFSSISAWAWILTITGFGMRYLDSNHPFLKYSNEAVIAFYILHQPVILCIGYFVIQWPVPDAAKWIMISLTSFAGTMLLYEYIVRRFDIFRFLFGMKLKSTRISDNK